jgi:type II secretory pathway pseudopilin PulG
MKQFATNTRESEFRPRTTAGSRPREKGYVLLTLLLVIALMGIFALAAASKIDFEIRRDRELEMIHRGVQYSRAIRAYYKKFQRYPTKLDDLDSTNNLRYLRKHYKDPLNKNGDFRLLHYGEQGVTLGGGLVGGGGSIPGATPVGSPTGLNGSAQNSSAFGSGSSGSSGFGNSGVNSSGVFAQSSGNSNTGFGANSNSQATTGQQGTTPASGSDPTQASTQVAPGTAQGDTSSSSQQLIASGPIVGVASISKKDTIREYNKKKRYNEWQFVYDPAFDRGGLITTPYQPSLAMAQSNLQPGTTGSTTGQSGFGQPASGQSSFGGSSFGQSPSGQSGFGNTGGSTTPVQPANPSPQQQ